MTGTAATITTYQLVTAAHVIANIGAFGVLAAWPWLPMGVPLAHRARARILGVVVTRLATVALATGVYLASTRDLWSEPWVLGPMAIMVIVLGLIGGYMTPLERRLADLSETPGAELNHSLAAARLAAIACFALIAGAAFLMVTKPQL